METLTLIVIDTDTHNDTNDIICYMIVFWELNSYWDNFQTFLHGERKEKIWIVCHIWTSLWWNLDKLFMCEWNDEIWTNCLCVNEMMKFGQFVYVWTDLNRFLNRLNRFLNRFYVWTGWTFFFLWSFYWNLNRFCVNRLNRFFYEVSLKFEQILLLFFFFNKLNRFYVWTSWTDFFMKFLWNLNRFCCFFFNWFYVWIGWTCFFYKKEKIEFLMFQTDQTD